MEYYKVRKKLRDSREWKKRKEEKSGRGLSRRQK
jgi:hypothetical protein